jgi:hypothetical protein
MDFHCSYLYYSYCTTVIPVEPCALNAEIQHFVLSCNISCWDLIKFPYFTDTTKRGVRGWKEAQRQGEFADISVIWWVSWKKARRRCVKPSGWVLWELGSCWV